MSAIDEKPYVTTTTVGNEWYHARLRDIEEEAFTQLAVAKQHADAGRIAAAVEELGKTVRFMIAAQRRLAHEVFRS